LSRTDSGLIARRRREHIEHIEQIIVKSGRRRSEIDDSSSTAREEGGKEGGRKSEKGGERKKKKGPTVGVHHVEKLFCFALKADCHAPGIEESVSLDQDTCPLCRVPKDGT